MYQDGVCFDPITLQKGLPENDFSQSLPNFTTPINTTATTTSFSMEELSYQEESAAAAAAAMEMELQQQLSIDTENCYANSHHGNLMDTSHLMQEMVGPDPNQVLIPNYDHNSTWDINNNTNMNNTHDFQEEHLMNHVNEMQNSHHLLNLLRLPKVSPSSVLPNSSLSLGFNFPDAAGGSASNVFYDPLLHLNLPPQPPYIRDLFQSLPQGYNKSGSLFGGAEEREGSGGGGEVRRNNFDYGVLEFQTDWEMNGIMAKVGNGKKKAKHYPTERDRREHLNGKYEALKKLIPSPSKPDRASVVADAIKHIKELLSTVNELKMLVEKKYGRERMKRHKTEDGTTSTTTAAGEVLPEESTKMIIKPDPDHHFYSNGSSTLRSSWLQRKSQDTEVDVRIVDDEVTIKLAQRKRINCLLVVSKLLDELQLDIQHVAGGLVGDNYSFLFNSKIGEGSSVYASAIANKLMDVVNRQYAAIPPTHNY